jgi:hypothetical protein
LLVVHALLLVWLTVLPLWWSVALALLLVWVGRAVLVRGRLLVVALDLLVTSVSLLGWLRAALVLRRRSVLKVC